MKQGIVAVLVAVLVIMMAVSSGFASTAVITELRKGKGTIEVRKAGQDVWKPAQPLQALAAGDMLRAVKDGVAVIVYSSGGRTVTVTASNSPLAVSEAKQADEQGAKVRQVFQDVAGFIAGKKPETLSAPMTVRKISRPPAIISPKDTQVFSSVRPEFEWIGPPRVHYRVKVLRGDATIWTSEPLSRSRIQYPDSAPVISPGEGYVWEIVTGGLPPVRASFQVASVAEEQAVKQELTLISAKSALPPVTAAVLRYGLLAQKGFHAEARKTLVAAIATEPDDPSLHLLLADYYRHVGLADLAAEEADEAEFLLRAAP